MAATLKNTLDLYKTKIVETLGAAGYAGVVHGYRDP